MRQVVREINADYQYRLTPQGVSSTYDELEMSGSVRSGRRCWPCMQ